MSGIGGDGEARTTPGRHARAVLRLLRDEGPTSRIVLAERLGLSPTTITHTVGPLLVDGRIEELAGPDAHARRGRPAIALRAVPEAVTVGGIQLGVGMIRAGLADGLARVRGVRVAEFDPRMPADDVLTLAAAELRAVISDDPGTPPCAIGVAAPGAVDGSGRVTTLAVNLGWRDIPVADLLERELSAPVHVEHNVRAMALAEAHYAEHPPPGRHRAGGLAYVYLRKRLGLGLVLRGAAARGGAHGVSELGHIQVDPAGVRCPCGNRGCLETVTSTVHLRAALEAAGVDATGVDDLDILTLVDAVRGSAVHEDFVSRMAQGLSIVANLTGPDAIVLGGAFATAPDDLLDDLADATAAATFPLVRPSVVIRRARLTEGGVAGAAAVALDAAVYGPPMA